FAEPSGRLRRRAASTAPRWPARQGMTMRRQRWVGRAVIAGALCLGAVMNAHGCAGTIGSPPAASPPKIALPPILAIELPAGSTSLPLDAPALGELLGGASAGPRKVTHDLAGPLRLGATRVTWTAWEGEPGRSAVYATRQATLYALPDGETPAGVA